VILTSWYIALIKRDTAELAAVVWFDGSAILLCIGLVGLAISYVLSMTALLNGVVTYFTETEKQMVSVERIDQYICDVPQESQSESIQVSQLCT